MLCSVNKTLLAEPRPRIRRGDRSNLSPSFQLHRRVSEASPVCLRLACYRTNLSVVPVELEEMRDPRSQFVVDYQFQGAGG